MNSVTMRPVSVPEVEFILEKWKSIFYENIPNDEKNKKWKDYINELLRSSVIGEKLANNYIKEYGFGFI